MKSFFRRILSLQNSPERDRCKQASETAWHVLSNCEALAAIRFRCLGYHFKKPGNFKDISVSRLLHFVQSAGLLHKWIQGLHKGSEMVDVHGTLWYPPYFHSILFRITWCQFPPIGHNCKYHTYSQFFMSYCLDTYWFWSLCISYSAVLHLKKAGISSALPIFPKM
jgi:hypothetical protein